MKRFLFLTCLVTPAIMLLWLVGCGGGGTGNDLDRGDTTDADFQFVDALMGEDVLAQISQSLDLTLALWDSIPDPQASGKGFMDRLTSQVDDSIAMSQFTYTYTAGWHIFEFSGYVTDGFDTVDISGIDSVQFLILGDPMQYPDSTVDEMKIRASFSVSDRSGWIAVSSVHSLDIAGITPELLDPVTISGTAQDDLLMSFEDSTGSCDFDMHSSLAVANVTGVIDGTGCPSSGTISASATLDMACLGTGEDPADQLDVNGTWTMEASFGNGLMHVTYNDGTTYWQATHDCGVNDDPLAAWIPRGL